MNRNEHNKRHNNNAGNQDGSKKSPVDDAEVEINDLATEGEPVSENTEADEEISELETLKNLLASKEEELEKEKKEYLFLMAEFDNFRKRTIRERGELIKNASEKSLQGILPIIDDFERGLDAIKDTSDAEAVKEGMRLIYNKLIKYLSDNGVKEIISTGAPFDTELHEAVAMIPATNDEEKGLVKETIQKGYMINDKVLRHAKVVVSQ